MANINLVIINHASQKTNGNSGQYIEGTPTKKQFTKPR